MVTTTRTQGLTELASKYFFNVFGTVGGKLDRIIERGEGIYAWDTNGKKYIDIASVTQSLNLGYHVKEVHDAVLKQMQRLEFAIFIDPCATDVAIEYAAELAKVTPPNINHSIFGSSGTEVVELAINTAKFYWYVRGKASKYKVICLTNGFHGSSLMGASLGGVDVLRTPFGPQAPGVVRIPDYYCSQCRFGLVYPDCGIRCAWNLEKAIQDEGEDSVACFIAEPEQGAGGAVSPPPEYFPIVAKICKEHNILFIADEVMSGFCRTGKMFAIEHWNVEPDMMTMCKGISGALVPMAALSISDEIWETLKGTFFEHGHSYSAHPVSCAAAKACLDIYTRRNIANHVAEVGKYARDRLERDFLPLPNVSDISGMGLLLSIGIVADKETNTEFPKEVNILGKLKKAHLEAGLLNRFYSFRPRAYFAPPLIITKEQVDEALNLMYPIIADLQNIKI
jgi:adenosylmethionine-8-amino-7-oxononanoate aminotransferase